MWAHGAWSIIELFFVGLAGFVWLGAGYFVFPSCMTIASLVRMYLWLANPTRYVRGEQTKFPMQFNCDPELTQQLLNEYNYVYSNNRDPVRRPLLARDEPAPRPLDRAQSAPGTLNRAPVRTPGQLSSPRADENEPVPIYVEPFEEKPIQKPAERTEEDKRKNFAPAIAELQKFFSRRSSSSSSSAGGSALPPLTRLWR